VSVSLINLDVRSDERVMRDMELVACAERMRLQKSR